MSRRRFRGLSTEEVLGQVPFRVRVGRVRWLIGLLVFAGGAALFVFALFFDTAGTTPMGAVEGRRAVAPNVPARQEKSA